MKNGMFQKIANKGVINILEIWIKDTTRYKSEGSFQGNK